MFIEVDGGRYIALTEVASAQKGKHPDHTEKYEDLRICITTREGERFWTRLKDWDFRRFLGSVIKADPGYELLHWFEYENGVFSFYREPIIAWLVGTDDPDPITVQGCVDDNYAILCPSGQVRNPYDSSHDTLDDWKKYMARAESNVVKLAKD